MPTTLQFRRYDTANIANTTGAVGELFIDTEKDTIVVQDGSTAGGFPLARESAITAIQTTANDALSLANTASSTANSAFQEANLAYDQANTARTQANTAYDQANTAYGQANTAYDQANTAYGQANTAYGQANAAYLQANTAATNALNAYGQANTAYDQANTARTQANTAYDQANAAYAEANLKLNISGGTINGSLNVSGNLTITGNTKYTNVETYIVSDPLIYLAANNETSDIVDIGFMGGHNTAGVYQHSGLARDAGDGTWYLFTGLAEEGHENNVVDFANTKLATLRANIEANNILLTGNTVATQANLTLAYNQANTGTLVAQNAYGQANDAYNQANSAYAEANLKLNLVGGTITGSLNVAETSKSNVFVSVRTALAAPNLQHFDGERLRLFDFNEVGHPNYAIGVEQNHIWMGVDSTANNQGFRWYGNTNVAMRLGGNGVLEVSNTVITNAFITVAGLNITDQANTARNQANSAYGQANLAYASANAAANTVRVSQNSGSTLSARQLNFVNTANVTIAITDSGDGNANVEIFSAAGGGGGGTLSNIAISSNGTFAVNANAFNFINTSTVSVTVEAGTSGNANLSFTSNGALALDPAPTLSANLNVNGYSIFAATNSNVSIQTSGSGATRITGDIVASNGDFVLNDGASFETIVQAIPATANQVISFPDATGVVGLIAGNDTQIPFNANGAYSASANLTFNAATNILTVGGGSVLRTNNIFTILIGDGSNTTYNITHNLNSTSTFFEVRSNTTGAVVYPDINVITSNTANVVFSTAPTTNSYRVSVFGV